MLPALFSSLFKHQIFWTPLAGGSWVNIHTTIFDCLKETQGTKEIVIKTLLEGGVHVVKVS